MVTNETMASTAEPNRLKTFQQHIDDMRNLVMCKICLKPLYEPFILACGHTYCYGCLRSWFVGLDNRKRKKNCPDCRADVRSTPSPNFILRDLVHMFVNRAELLAEDETIDEHLAGRIAEADLLAADKDGKGLFQGIFKTPFHPLGNLGPLRDFTDGISRCPHCLWELEDGDCLHCGYALDLDNDFSTDDDDDEGESLANDEQSIVSDETSSSGDYDVHNGNLHRFIGAHSAADDVDASIGTGGYSELEYGTPNPHDYEDSIDGFIDDHDFDEPDEIDEEDAIDGIHSIEPQHRRPGRRYQIHDEEDDEDDNEVIEDDDDDDESEVHYDPGRGYNWHPGGPPSTINDSDEDDNESQIYGESVDNETEGPDRHGTLAYHESDSDGRSETPMAIPMVSRRRAVIISDEDDEDEEEENYVDNRSNTQGRSQSESAEEDDDGNQSSDSADTTVAIQTLHHSVRQPENPRKRRRTSDTWRAIARHGRVDSGVQRGRPSTDSRGHHSGRRARFAERAY